MRSKRARRHSFQKKLDRLTKNVIYGLATAAMGVSCWQHSPDVACAGDGTITDGAGNDISSQTSAVIVADTDDAGTGNSIVIKDRDDWTTTDPSKAVGVDGIDANVALSNNTLTLDGVTLSDSTSYAAAAVTGNSNVTGNKLIIQGKSNLTVGSIYGAQVYGNRAIDTADYNEVLIKDSVVSANYIYGVCCQNNYGSKNSISYNKVTVEQSADITGVPYIYGASGVGNSETMHNEVVIDQTGRTCKVFLIYGAYGKYKTNYNKVEILGGTFVENNWAFYSYGMYGAYIGTDSTEGNSAEGNCVLIHDGAFNIIIAGARVYNNAVAKNNYVAIAKGTFNDFTLEGVYSHNGSAEGNYVAIDNGSFSNVFCTGGESRSGTATGNYISIKDGSFENSTKLYGGYSRSADASDNYVDIQSGTFDKIEIAGGISDSGNANKNAVRIAGGTFDGVEIFGGYTGDSDHHANDNTVAISGGTWTGANKIYGGYAADKDLDGSENNVLKLSNIKNMSVSELGGFTEIDFNLENVSVASDDVIIDNTNAVDLTYTKTNAKELTIADNSSLTYGGELVLIANAENADVLEENHGEGVLYSGKLLKYDTKVVGGTADDARFRVVLGENPNPIVPEAKSLMESQTGAVATASRASEFILSDAWEDAKDAAVLERADAKRNGRIGEFAPFAAVAHSKMRAETGSHVDSKGTNIDLGLVREIDWLNGTLLYGAAVEYGHSTYDSYLDSGIKSGGTVNSYGLGIFARHEREDGFYLEGSLHAGRVYTDYCGNGFVKGTEGIGYGISAPYWGVNLGVGKLFRLNDDSTMNLYAKHFYMRQGSASAAIDGNGCVDFAASTSRRLRLGTRYSHAVGMGSVYAGVAYEREYDGTAYGSFAGYDMPTASLRGDSMMYELGYKVDKAKSCIADVALVGYTGTQRGMMARASINWYF